MNLTVGELRRWVENVDPDLPLVAHLMEAPAGWPENAPRPSIGSTLRLGIAIPDPARPSRPGDQVGIVAVFTAEELIDTAMALAVLDPALMQRLGESKERAEVIQAARRLVEAVQEAHETQDDGSEEWNAGKAFEALQETVEALSCPS